MPVVTGLAVLQREITIDQNGGRLPFECDKFVDDFAEMTGHRGIGRMLFPNVRVVEQVNEVVIKVGSESRTRTESGQTGTEGAEEFATTLPGQMNWHC